MALDMVIFLWQGADG